MLLFVSCITALLFVDTYRIANMSMSPSTCYTVGAYPSVRLASAAFNNAAGSLPASAAMPDPNDAKLPCLAIACGTPGATCWPPSCCCGMLAPRPCKPDGAWRPSCCSAARRCARRCCLAGLGSPSALYWTTRGPGAGWSRCSLYGGGSTCTSPDRNSMACGTARRSRTALAPFYQ